MVLLREVLKCNEITGIKALHYCKNAMAFMAGNVSFLYCSYKSHKPPGMLNKILNTVVSAVYENFNSKRTILTFDNEHCACKYVKLRIDVSFLPFLFFLLKAYKVELNLM